MQLTIPRLKKHEMSSVWFTQHSLHSLPHSRPPAESDRMLTPMERPFALEPFILHPGMMHTLMSFLGCIGKLMKASAWCGRSHQCSICWYHQHCQRKGLDQCSMGIYRVITITAEFLLEWHEDIRGPKCLYTCISGVSQRTPDREAMGGLSGQDNIFVSYLPASG